MGGEEGATTNWRLAGSKDKKNIKTVQPTLGVRPCIIILYASYDVYIILRWRLVSQNSRRMEWKKNQWPGYRLFARGTRGRIPASTRRSSFVRCCSTRLGCRDARRLHDLIWRVVLFGRVSSVVFWNRRRRRVRAVVNHCDDILYFK